MRIGMDNAILCQGENKENRKQIYKFKPHLNQFQMEKIEEMK